MESSILLLSMVVNGFDGWLFLEGVIVDIATNKMRKEEQLLVSFIFYNWFCSYCLHAKDFICIRTGIACHTSDILLFQIQMICIVAITFVMGGGCNVCVCVVFVLNYNQILLFQLQ